MQLLTATQNQSNQQNLANASNLFSNGKSLVDLSTNDNYKQAIQDLHQVMVKHFDDSNVKKDWRKTFPKGKGYIYNCFNGFYRLPITNSPLLQKLLISEITAMGYSSLIDLWKITDQEGRIVYNTVPKGFKVRPKGTDKADKIEFTDSDGWAYFEEFHSK